MFRLYKKYLKKYIVLVILGPLFKLVEAIFELLVPLVVANMINNGINNDLLSYDEKKSFILSQGGLLVLFATIGLLSTLVCQFISSRVSQGFGTLLRDDLYKHINTLSFKEIDRFSASSLLTRMNSDIENMQTSVARIIRLLIRAPFLVIGATILSFTISYKAGLIFLVTGILLFFTIFIIMYFTVPRNKEAQAKLDCVTKITKENLSGNRIVRAFNRQKHEFVRFMDECVSLEKIQNKLGKLNALLNPLIFIISNLAIVVVLYVGGFEFSYGNLNQGNIISLYNYFLQIELAIVVVSNLVVVFTKAYASAARINEVFDTTSSIIPGNEVTKANDIPFVFNNVTFKYNETSNPALKNISFTINENESIGIIGSTGSGKTSLVYLMNRFYDVTSGEILFYGKNIKDYDLKFINDNVSIVMQKAILFSGTIKENILWGKTEANDEEVSRALEISQAKEFVSNLENKEETILYQNGSNLSGGQRQRLSIARAIIKDSPILILDDSTSALDFKTESNLRANIKALNKTVVVISSRVSSLIHMDKILVLENGKLVGIGCHNDLIKTCSVYKEICDSQDIGGDINEI